MQHAPGPGKEWRALRPEILLHRGTVPSWVLEMLPAG